MTGQIILQVILIALSAFFTFAEVSAVSVSDSKLDKLVPQANKQKFWEMFDNKKIPWLTEYFSITSRMSGTPISY